MTANSTKYNILYLHPVSKWMGGGETGLIDFITHMDRGVFNPVVIIPHKGPLYERLLDLNVKTYLMSMRRWESLETRLTLGFKIFSLIYRIKKDRIHLIHAHSHETTPFAVLASRYTHVPVISHIRIQISMEQAQKYLVHHADMILTKSVWQREEISRIPQAKVISIGDGFDFGKYRKNNILDHKRMIRNPLGIEEDALVLLSVSRFEERKNFELAIKAISRLKDQKIYLLLVGAKEDRNPYEEKIKHMISEFDLQNRIKIIPFIGNVTDYLIASDVFIQTSKKEGLSRAAIEAMITGLPLIVTDIPGSQELIVDEQNGFLIESDHVEQLAEKILLFYDDRAIIRKMGDAGRCIAERHFDIDQYYKKIKNIYLDLIERDHD